VSKHTTSRHNDGNTITMIEFLIDNVSVDSRGRFLST